MIEIAFMAVMIPLIAAAGIVLGLLFKGIDRILAARMQARVGPPVSQPFIDVKKLLMKESIVPKDAVRWAFSLSPVFALAASAVILLYLPVGGFAPLLEGHGDMILVLYLLLLPSLALVIGGFSSGSPYATVGAQREMVTIMGFEFPLAVSVVSVAWLLSQSVPGVPAFSLLALSSHPVWGLAGPVGAAGLLLLFAVMMFVMPGELGRVPFDVAEAETELAGGLLTEYSGRNLALFYLADAVKAVAMASIVIALFIPYGISGAAGLHGITGMMADALFYMVKLFAVIFIGSTFIRVAVARLRITQVVRVYWGYSTLIALAGLMLIAIDLYIRSL